MYGILFVQRRFTGQGCVFEMNQRTRSPAYEVIDQGDDLDLPVVFDIEQKLTSQITLNNLYSRGDEL